MLTDLSDGVWRPAAGGRGAVGVFVPGSRKEVLNLSNQRAALETRNSRRRLSGSCAAVVDAVGDTSAERRNQNRK